MLERGRLSQSDIFSVKERNRLLVGGLLFLVDRHCSYVNVDMLDLAVNALKAVRPRLDNVEDHRCIEREVFVILGNFQVPGESELERAWSQNKEYLRIFVRIQDWVS